MAVGIATAAVAVGAAFLLTGGGSEPAGPRALTSDEADRLAITRFRNYEARGRAVTITVPGTAGGLTVTGSVDYRGRIGYGVVHGTGRETSSEGLIEWTADSVFVHPMANAPEHAPASPPRTGWVRRPLLSAGSSLDTSLTIALGLGSDRPDNAGLLAQNGAAWWGRDRVDGHPVDVMTGPSSRNRPDTAGNVRYWVGPDGTMRRVRAEVGSAPRPVDITFDTQPFRPVTPVAGAAPKN
ncbi:hypothetical protein [Streptomyces sp. NPDC048659]|uniref:hypothetical protein n=1 Tax=Streptomyces sp. NPDC048659 TaxID=3155489 RepID=UPI00343B4AE7